MSAGKDAHIALFPPRSAYWGPITRQRVLRTFSVYCVVAAIGIALVTLARTTALAAFGLGLIVPGGGFLLWANADGAGIAAHVFLFVASAAAFIVALAVWFATGMFLLPFTVWIATAIGAGSMSHTATWRAATIAVPAIAVAMIGCATLAFAVVRYIGLRERAEINRHLKIIDTKTIFAEPVPHAATPELGERDLRLLRLLLDRALQPIDQFEGFEWLDQFQTAAVRYQLNFMSYALSLAQSVHMPALQGYMTEAQNRLVLKQCDYRVWRYWELENLWGNFKRGADPIPHDNIMFTGFLATQIALYHAASGQRHFDVRGSLTFKHPGSMQFRYSLPELATILSSQHKTAPFALIACEPNWIYPMCNLIGATGLRTIDTLTGTQHWPLVADQFIDKLESEFVMPGGAIVACRSNYLGFALPPIGGAVVQAMPCLFLTPLARI